MKALSHALNRLCIQGFSIPKDKDQIMKSLILLIVTFAALFAESESTDVLYGNLEKVDTETQKTIQQYLESAYNVSAHKANYFLPASYRMEDNFENPQADVPDPIQTEIEFQISLKYEFGSNFFGLNESYAVAYSQRSFWQFYVPSAYFRESNYNPEFFITTPIPTKVMKGVRVGFAHMSNGRGGENERSWNYFYSNLYFQYKYLFIDLKLWASTHASRAKYNDDLLDYLGYGHLKFTVPIKKHLIDTTFRYAKKGYAAELNYTYPLTSAEDLYVYVKGFSGYGESLIDYNNKVNKIGIGFSISR